MKYLRGDLTQQELRPNNIDYQQLQLIPKSSRVLEIGSSSGFMTKYLQNVLSCKVVSVEISPELAHKSKREGNEVVCGDFLDDEVQSYLKQYEKFDVILASQVLEHIVDTSSFFIRSKSLLRSGGYLIVSTANIAHWSSRLRLLMGKWEYEEYGLFDREHVRFFTPASLRNVFTKHGFSVDKLDYNIVDFSPFPFHPKYGFLNMYSILSKIPLLVPVLSLLYKRLCPDFFAYQFVIRGKYEE